MRKLVSIYIHDKKNIYIYIRALLSELKHSTYYETNNIISNELLLKSVYQRYTVLSFYPEIQRDERKL